MNKGADCTGSSQLRILLVEDDRPLAQAVLGYLHSKLFSVDWAETLQQAVPW